jgi:hypothetical protein
MSGEGKQLMSKKAKAAEKSKAKKAPKKAASEYQRDLHEDGQFGGDGAQDRARQRRFQVTEEPITRHPGLGGAVPDIPGLPGLVPGPGSTPNVSEDQE